MTVTFRRLATGIIVITANGCGPETAGSIPSVIKTAAPISALCVAAAAGDASTLTVHNSELMSDRRDSSLFSVPVVRLPGSGITNAPPVLPVIFEGEHVAKAILSEDSYQFHMFQGNLQSGLKDGSLFVRPRYCDAPTHERPYQRDYLAVEIARNPNCQTNVHGRTK